MDGSALHPLHACVKLALQTGGDFIRRLVGEREDADSLGVDRKPFDEESNALDEAECLPRTGAGEDEYRA
jgi:hypothetical protein